MLQIRSDKRTLLGAENPNMNILQPNVFPNEFFSIWSGGSPLGSSSVQQQGQQWEETKVVERGCGGEEEGEAEEAAQVFFWSLDMWWKYFERLQPFYLFL